MGATLIKVRVFLDIAMVMGGKGQGLTNVPMNP